MFKPATRKKLKLRMAIDGPSGSGKTYTALRCATALGKKIVAIDTEHGSMSKYQGELPDGIPWKWQVCELQNFDPKNYTLAIRAAKQQKPDVLIIDSLSHAWEGVGGALEQVEKSKSANKYTAWKEVTPKHREMVEAILGFPGHVIVTMRSKMEHVLEENEKGKMVPRKIGMAPIQRPGTEYEFDIVGEMDWDHNLLITKTRCPAVDGLRAAKPGPDFMEPILRWLDDGEAVKPGAGVGKDEAEEAKETPPPATATDRWNGTPATPGQVEKIKSLALQVYGMEKGVAAIKAALAKRKKNKLAELTDLEADDLVLKLKAKIEATEQDSIPY